MTKINHVVQYIPATGRLGKGWEYYETNATWLLTVYVGNDIVCSVFMEQFAAKPTRKQIRNIIKQEQKYLKTGVRE